MLDNHSSPFVETPTAEEDARRKRLLAQQRALRALPGAGRDETSDLVARFLAAGGAVTRCAPAYLVPCQVG